MTLRKLGIMRFFLATAALVTVYAKNPLDNETWRTLESAKQEYIRGEYGNALSICEKARKTHVDFVTIRMEELKKSLSSREVKKAGDGLADVRSKLVERNENSSVEILDSIIDVYSSKKFGDSISSLITWLEGTVVYPEADLLAGMIYEAEGERQMALRFYESAWAARDYLDIPSEKYEIAYRMADLSELTGKFGDQEKYLLLVLVDDSLFGAPGKESPTLTAMKRTIVSENSTDKFFRLYRYENRFSLKACQDLARLYLRDNRADRALSCAVLASAISVSMLSSSVLKSDFSYEYAGLRDLMTRAGKIREVVAFAADNKIWDSFLYLSLAMRQSGYEAQAHSLLIDIGGFCPDYRIARMASDELDALQVSPQY